MLVICEPVGAGILYAIKQEANKRGIKYTKLDETMWSNEKLVFQDTPEVDELVVWSVEQARQLKQPFAYFFNSVIEKDPEKYSQEAASHMQKAWKKAESLSLICDEALPSESFYL